MRMVYYSLGISLVKVIGFKETEMLNIDFGTIDLLFETFFYNSTSVTSQY